MIAPAPAAFVAFKDLVRSHLKQILKLDQHTVKVPIHTVALIVMVAYEALARFTAPASMTKKIDTHWLFAKRHKELYDIDESIGQRIFDAFRNGLAHVYGTYAIPIERQGEVRLILCWKGGAAGHLKGLAGEVVNDELVLYPLPKGFTGFPPYICVDCETLWTDLDTLFTETETTLTTDPDARALFERRVTENREQFTDRLKGSDPELWRALFSSRRVEEEEGA